MRHLWSLLAGLVVAPLAWLFLATGQYRSSRTVATWNAESFFDTGDLIGPAAFLAAAGILLGLIGTLRLSPAGPLVAGLLLVAPTIFMFINPFETLDAFSVDQQRRLLGQDFQPWLPVENGTLLVLGTLLLVAVFSAQRWRQWPGAPALAPPATVTEHPPGGDPERTGEPPQPMSDEEILAAAAEMERDERTTAAGDASTEDTKEFPPSPEPGPEPTRESTPESPPETAPPRGNETGSGTRSGASGTG